MRIPQTVRAEVFARDGYRCRYCKAQLDPRIAGIDHIVPVSKGGTDDLSNLATACPTCNMLKGDKLLDLVSMPIAKQLARGWITAFLRAPRATAIVSLVVAVVAAVTLYVVDSGNKRQQELQRLESQTYTAQITRLNDTELRIHELLSFVTDQKNTLKKTEDAIAALKAERDSLAPLVESQQKVVDALFTAQEKRSERAIKKERWIGFGLGVGSSIVASAVWMIGAYFFEKRKLPDDAPKPATGAGE